MECGYAVLVGHPVAKHRPAGHECLLEVLLVDVAAAAIRAFPFNPVKVLIGFVGRKFVIDDFARIHRHVASGVLSACKPALDRCGMPVELPANLVSCAIPRLRNVVIASNFQQWQRRPCFLLGFKQSPRCLLVSHAAVTRLRAGVVNRVLALLGLVAALVDTGDLVASRPALNLLSRVNRFSSIFTRPKLLCPVLAHFNLAAKVHRPLGNCFCDPAPHRLCSLRFWCRRATDRFRHGFGSLRGWG